eukprot:34764-Pelagomonas_calceolata.AAC.4
MPIRNIKAAVRNKQDMNLCAHVCMHTNTSLYTHIHSHTPACLLWCPPALMQCHPGSLKEVVLLDHSWTKRWTTPSAASEPRPWFPVVSR